MRRVLLVVALSACNLYFGPDPHGGGGHQQHPDGGGVPDATCGGVPDAQPAPDAPPSGYWFATCIDGQIVLGDVQTQDVPPADLAQNHAVIASCASRCRAPVGIYECLGDPGCAGADAFRCEPDGVCPADGACSGSGTSTCSAAAGCGISVQTEVCTCTGGKEVCQSPCTDGLCSPLDVLAKMAGHWHGIVTPPDFASPYEVDLVIGKDGHLNPHGSGYYTAFYYGQDGPDPNRWFNILAETPSGAVGLVGVEFSPQEILPGLVTGLHVSADRMKFTFWDSWLSDCTRPFAFDLTRVP